MKKIMAIALAAIIAISMSGCAEVILQPQVPLSDGTATGAKQTITVQALNSKVAVSEIPVLAEKQAGVKVASNSKGYIDYSNASEGYIDVKYTGGKNVKIMVQIYLTTENKYNYAINNTGVLETIAFTEGSGKYTVKIMENTQGNSYAPAYATEIEVNLRNELLPFLYSNNTVNYTPAVKSVAKAAELVKDAKSDIEKVELVYKYVVGNVTYDNAFANKIVTGAVSGHVPVLDTTLETKKGICFDYAALMAGMLRSQGVPVRLVKGYAGTAYHAWIDVYIQGVGWIDSVISFDGQNWTMMDPTFVSTSKNANAVAKFVGDGSNYTPKTVH